MNKNSNDLTKVKAILQNLTPFIKIYVFVFLNKGGSVFANAGRQEVLQKSIQGKVRCTKVNVFARKGIESATGCLFPWLYHFSELRGNFSGETFAIGGHATRGGDAITQIYNADFSRRFIHKTESE